MMNTGFRFGQALLFCLFVSTSIFYAIAASEEASVQRVITAPLKDGRTNIIDGSGKEYAIDSVSLDGKGDWTGDSTRVSVSTVALFTLAMAAASGLGAVPFFFVELDSQWSGICNGMAAGVMLAASFDLIQEGQEHGSGGWVVCGILAGGIFILLCKKGIADSSCRDACNRQNDERHEECVEMVERSFMSKSKQLANMSSSGMGTSSGIGPSSSADISSEEDTLCAEPKAMDTEVQRGYQGKNTCTVDEADCRLNELYSVPCTEAFDLIGKFENCLADGAGHSYDTTDESNVASRLELSLRTFNPSNSNDEGSREQSMISHSKASAFSKYENKKTLQPLYSGFNSNSAALKEGSSASTWRHDASLTESQHNTTALAMCQPGNHKTATSGTPLSFNPVDRVTFRSMAANQTHMHPSVSHMESDCDQVQSPKSQSPHPTSSLTYSSSEVQISEHCMQPFDDTTFHSEDNVAEAENGKLLTVEKAGYDSATCGSSDLGSGVTNKLSNSRSGSSSNEATGSSFSVLSPGRAPVSESVNYDDILHDKTKVDNHSTSQREAALMKFRLKRKDRCFEKKVRYQSRKRLAEQRPRVKGQFVRQLQNETQPLKDNGGT